VEIPEGRSYEVHENTANSFYIIVRYEPLEDALKLHTLPHNPTVIQIAQWVVTMVQENNPVAQELLTDPLKAAKRLGIPVPEGMHIKVLQSTAAHQHLAIPYTAAAPAGAGQELSDAQLDMVAGGKHHPTLTTNTLVAATVTLVAAAAVVAAVAAGVTVAAVVVP